ncbi:MAG: hypothetical protein ETSY1_38175 [Candidatus Entotheonella factor]|uniref:EamA domain-containing protein n=1 Tax=Entotheonella factor TaxID=1429438 RepID=W4L6K9_ENTF1|nr:MAG: hypothetical protein ETSY1_38175 [Candidatus Entotheonella factor]
MPLWVWLTLGTVLAQTARNAIARSMVEEISAPLNSWARYAFMLPWLFPVVIFFVMRSGMPHVSPSYLAYAVIAAICQITGGVLLIMAFKHSNFAQSVIFHKLGVVFIAVIGVLFFQESPSRLAWLGILLCSVGIVLMNIGRELGPSGWRQAFHLDRGGVLAVMCALILACFNFTAKRSLQILVQDNPHLQEASFESLILACFLVTALDTVILTLYLLLRHSGQFRHVCRLWPRMVMVGTASLANSLMWFWAVSLTLVAYVAAVSQIESALAVLLGLIIWREHEVWRQIPGVALLIGGMTLVILG